ncbi:MAG TPA: DNA gyrase inhibitor YacG [Patescibacteria group bacterium]|nr:DNA gyrase inhibitor YacG [Patescibacteria group bacterium]
MKVKCPTCKKTGDWFAGQYGPFCSRRCKMVDLGKWFTEEHLISSPMKDENLQDFPSPEPRRNEVDSDDFV